MNSTIRRSAVFIAGLAVLALGTIAPIGQAQAKDTVTLTGNAYAFIFAGNLARLEGAVIKVVEYPELQTTAGPNGAYSLEVPNHASITPYATYPGYYTVHDQTFFTRDRDLNQVNFQMPQQNIAEALAGVVGASMEGEAGSKVLTHCAVVSTFFQKEGRSFLDFDDFHDFRPHGIENATAVMKDPAGVQNGNAIYFNSNVIPDPSREFSSHDGGVLWKDVPTGTFTVTGSHPTTRFSQFQVNCAPGRLVNANPPWGLYELARTEEPNPAVFAAPEPDPEPVPVDEELRAWVASAKVAKTGPRKRVLSVEVVTREKVDVSLLGTQGKRRVKRGPKRLEAGTSTIKVPVGAAFKQGSLDLKVTLTDEAGNAGSSSSKLSVPKVKKKKKSKR